ncbi:hypothetical protein ALC57_06709 [Trachymyrmex cornetzi]|uniref:Uncharacterized protein n=1 Tax=Trachymyrmex cornetzi TaxID=471704 RepID=A0A195E6J9_9HYME|nr:hypothetical protein ALC57_06709 [Trachymyrmex cornetzi]
MENEKVENKESTEEGRKKTSVPLIHVCVHSLHDNGCSLGDIEIASVKVTYLSIYEKERRVDGLEATSIIEKFVIDDIARVTVMALNRDAEQSGKRSRLVCISMYHDHGDVGNSRSIRNADTYSMAGTSGHIPPLCRAASSLEVIGFHVSKEEEEEEEEGKENGGRKRGGDGGLGGHSKIRFLRRRGGPVLFRIIDVKNILEALINVGREDVREGQQRRSSHTPSCYWISIGKRLFLSSDRGCHFGSFVIEMENFVSLFLALSRAGNIIAREGDLHFSFFSSSSSSSSSTSCSFPSS